MRRSIQVAAGLIAGSVLVTGLAIGGPHQTPAAAAATPRAGRSATATPAAPPSSTATPAPPQPPRQQVIVLASGEDAASTFTISVVTPAGRTLATTTVQDSAIPQAEWSVTAADGAAYWASGGALHRLDSAGRVTDLAAVPANESGRVAVSPDGTQWVYATFATDAAGVNTNDLWHGGVGIDTEQIAHRLDDPSHPPADAPSSWQYYLGAWTARGVVAVRQPTGGCGCGAFDMQMSAEWSLLVDPSTGDSTPITTAANCPLAGVSAAGTAVCFHDRSAGGTDAIRFIGKGRTASTVALSGLNEAGDAVFSPDGAAMAYATIPTADAGCGGNGTMTLRVMDVASGNAAVVAAGQDLQPKAWLGDGEIVATDASSDTTSAVVVNSTTGAMTTLSTTATRIVGVG